MNVIAKTYLPFIRLKTPFVGNETAFIIPFVGHKYPFICISGKSWGFTVIELIVTLAVAAILVTLAIPAMDRIIEQNRLSSFVNDFSHSLQVARSAAIKHSRPVFVCRSSDGATCAGAGSWDVGWIAFVDDDNSGGLTGSDIMLTVHEGVVGKNKFTGSASDTITFDRLGAASAGDGNYVICNSTVKKNRTIAVGITGRSSVTEGDC